MGAIKPYTCDVCGFEVWIPLLDLDVSEVGLYSDARFPGRCVVVLTQHETEIENLPTSLAISFTQDVLTVGRAIKKAVGADKINYAVLGNTAPHLHAHVIPRVWSMDPIPEKSPWQHPLPSSKLDPESERSVIERIKENLGEP